MGTYRFAVFDIPYLFLRRFAARCARVLLVSAIALGALLAGSFAAA